MREDDKENKDLRQALAKFPRELLEEALAMREETDSDEQPSPPTAEVRSILHSRTFSGPLPPPDILDHYNQVVDEGANRIVEMAEKEQAHRHNLETTSVEGNIKSEKRGQNYALLICTLVILGGFILTWRGHEISGSIYAVGGLASLAYVFIRGRSQPRNNNQSTKPE